jgi:hypothetical protein
VTASWVPNYNAKANPVSVRLRRPDLQQPAVKELLRASYEILRDGAQPWSERERADDAVDTTP